MKMGFEGLAYYGAKGSTASTLITNRRDINFDTDPQMAPTTVAGAGTSVPIECEQPTTLKWSATITIPHDTADAVLEALRVAAGSAGQIALRLKSYASGKGYNGDVNVKESFAGPLNGDQVYSYTLTPNNTLRAPQLYV